MSIRIPLYSLSSHHHIITPAFHLQLTSLSNYLQNLLLQPLPSAQHAFLHHRPHCSPSSRWQVSTALSIEKPFFLLTQAPDSSALAGNNCKCQVGDTQFDSLTEQCCNQINNGFDTYHADQHHQVYPHYNNPPPPHLISTPLTSCSALTPSVDSTMVLSSAAARAMVSLLLSAGIKRQDLYIVVDWLIDLLIDWLTHKWSGR